MEKENTPVTKAEIRENLAGYLGALDVRLVTELKSAAQKLLNNANGILQNVTATIRQTASLAIPLEYRIHELSSIIEAVSGQLTVVEMQQALATIIELRTKHFIGSYHPPANTGLLGAIEEMKRQAEAVLIDKDLPRLQAILEGKKPEVADAES